MSTLTELITEHRITATNPFASSWESDEAAVRMAKALEAVLAKAEEWRYKGEFGWGAWQEGEGPDPEGYALDNASSELREAITAALTETKEATT